MLAAGLITFREGLEAALIVGIVLGYLKKIGRLDRQAYVWGGVLGATLASIAVAFGLQFVGAKLAGTAEQLFEGVTMFLAVAILTWMIFWMRYQARYIKSGLEREVRTAIGRGQNWGLASLTFFAVFREGVETVLFLTAAAFVASEVDTLWGGLIGLLLAVAVGWMIYASSVRLDTRRFFDITSVLLLLFAAGLLAHGVHEFQEAGLLPTFIEHVWNTNSILDEKSTLGSMLKAVFGYNGDPSLLEVVSYAGYWVVVLLGSRWWNARQTARLVQPAQ